MINVKYMELVKGPSFTYVKYTEFVKRRPSLINDKYTELVNGASIIDKKI